MHNKQLTPIQENVQDVRRYPIRPHVGVGGVILWKDTVLLIRRKNNPDTGKWSIPGGHLELGEKIAEGALRECEEETNLSLAVREPTKPYDKIIYDKDGRIEYHYVLIDFLMEPIGDFSDDNPPKPIPSSEVDLAKFVKIKNLKRYALPDAVKELFTDLGYFSPLC